MSQSISTLLIRNLDDVFGEGDPQRRRAAPYRGSPSVGVILPAQVYGTT